MCHDRLRDYVINERYMKRLSYWFMIFSLMNYFGHDDVANPLLSTTYYVTA